MPSSPASHTTSEYGSADSAKGTRSLKASFAVSFSYPVHFTSNVFDVNNPVLRQSLMDGATGRRHRVLVLVDEGVATHHPQLCDRWIAYADHHCDAILSAGTPIVVPGGEAVKDDTQLQDRLSQYIEVNAIDRHSYIIAIGGGAMLDAVGLAAATAHRGVRLVRMPTTVLAQNDAGIGVKNGINRFGQKNWYGTFAPPYGVINDDHFLQTLTTEHRRAGMSEAVKVALIRDAEFFEWIEANAQALARFESSAVRYLIERCAELHLQQITGAGDPFEQGTARPLDFGHWAAHRLEKITLHRMSHGDAVAIGIALDCRYSQRMGMLSDVALNRILNVLQTLGFPLYDAALDARDNNGVRTVMAGLDDFQRHLGGELSVTLLDAIGKGTEAHTMDKSVLEHVLSEMQSGAASCA